MWLRYARIHINLKYIRECHVLLSISLAYTYTYLYTHTPIHIHTHIHILTYSHTYSYICTHRYTYTYRRSDPNHAGVPRYRRYRTNTAVYILPSPRAGRGSGRPE